MRSEAEHLEKQLPFLVWFIVSSLLHTFKRESDGGVLRATGVVMKSAVSLAVEEGVTRAFGRVLGPLKTALTERMMAGEGEERCACAEILGIVIDGCERLRPPQMRRMDSFPGTRAFEALQRRLTAARPTRAPEATLSDAMHDFVDAPSVETLASLEKGLRSRTLELAGIARLRDSCVSTRRFVQL